MFLVSSVSGPFASGSIRFLCLLPLLLMLTSVTSSPSSGSLHESCYLPVLTF